MPRIFRSLTLYAAAGALCAAGLVIDFRLWEADLRIPLYYLSGDDVFFSDVLVKTTVETGWYLTNPLLGAPGVFEAHDFPLPDVLHRVAIKLLASALGDHGLTLNVFFLSAFVLETWACVFALRRLRAPGPVAVALGVLFAFLPFHFFRGEGHLSQGAYYPVPLMLLVVLWQSEGRRLFWGPSGGSGARPRWAWSGAKPWLAAAACLLTSASGVYETFFASFFVLVAACAAPRRVRAPVRALDALTLLLLLVGPLSLYVLPTVRYWKAHGPNPAVGARVPEEASHYGLSILHLMVPNPGHRIPTTWHMVKEAPGAPQAPPAPPPNENRFCYLGAVGVSGFLVLVAALFWNGRAPRSLRRLAPLSRLNAAALLLGTIGGFGLAFAVLVSPKIRAYNRISIHIAFLSLAAASVLLTAVWRRYPARSDRVVYLTALAAGLALGLLDQTSPAFTPHHRALALAYARDGAFVRAVEARLPRGAMVFQLPYVPFPEHGPTHKMRDYDHFRPYFHSEAVHWSYGAMKGREADRWQRSVASLHPVQMIDRLCRAGFDGLYIDRFGYDDGARQLEAMLRAYLASAPVVDGDGRLAFYRLPAAAPRRPTPAPSPPPRTTP